MAQAEDEHDDYVPSFEVPRRAVWPWLVGLVLALAAGGYFGWRAWTKPKPLRVLVAIDLDGYWWDGSKPAAKLADELGDFLKDMGFEPVRGGDPEVVKVLEHAASPLEAAAELRAAFVVSAVLDPQAVELPIDGGYYEVQLVSTLSVQHIEERAPFFETPIETHSGARSRAQALELLAKTTSKVAVDVVLPALFSHPSIAEIVRGHDVALVEQLAPGKKFVDARNGEMDRAKTAYDALAKKREDEEHGVGGLTFHSGASANDMLIGVGDQGVLRVTSPVTPFYHPATGELLRRELLETVEWVSDGDPEVVWRGYNVFTYPSAAPAGMPVVMVEDLYGWARGLAVLDGKAARRIRVEPEHAISEPRIAPDAKTVALVDKTCRDCPREIAVLDLADGKQLLRLGAEEYPALGEFKWLDAKRLLVVAEPAPATGGEEAAEEDAGAATLGLYIVSVPGGARELLMAAEGRSMIDPAASPDAKRIAVSDYRTRIHLLDAASKERRDIDVGGEATALSFSPDGSRVVFEVAGGKRSAYHEIGILEVASGEVRLLTGNDSPDRFPLFSRDGKRVYFEARNEDPVFEGLRAVSRIASLPVP